MKRALAFLSFICIFWALLWEADASWLIDARRFHISAHGQTSCLDCHEDTLAQVIHPNPLDVNKKRESFFKADLCLTCHEEIEDQLEEGVHGRKAVDNPAKYQICIRCHKPHVQPRLGKNRIGRFSPDKPHYEQCGACHEEKATLPAFSKEDQECMACHLAVDVEDPAGVDRIAGLCFYCHAKGESAAQRITRQFLPDMDRGEYSRVAHAEIACTVCHPDGAQFLHKRQSPTDCRQCHAPHDEAVAHDAHVGVSCGACHLSGVEPIKAPDSGIILWERTGGREKSSHIHQMTIKDKESSCRRCHFAGNGLGAAAMVLPPKSVICMPCHTATFSAGDTITILSLLVFVAGFVLFFSYWLTAASGTRHGSSSGGHAVAKVLAVLKALFWDVLLQRRLYKLSRGRWLIHSMIFYPFVIRFSWGLLALVGSIWRPEWTSVWPMLDKNHPLTAFVFEVTGVMVIIGLICAFIRGFIRDQSKDRVSGLPGQDRLALGLILGIVVVGFSLEAVRIAMTGWPAGSGYAFLGYLISLILPGPPALTSIFGYIWYLHAILTGGFIAYLPFSRLSHMIMAPVVLTMNAGAEAGHREPARRGEGKREVKSGE
jgi:nitrate reductase gamma subunit